MPRLPTRDQLRIWRDFIETTEALRGRIAVRLQADAGLSPGDYTVLLALSEAPDHQLRPSALGRAIGWERSRLSHHLSRMERRGLIERTPVVSRTETGTAAFSQATFPHLAAVKDLFVDALTPGQLRALDDATAALKSRLAVTLDRPEVPAALPTALQSRTEG